MTIKTILVTIKNLLLSNRFKSFYWRTGMMVLAVIVSALSEFIAGFQLNTTVTVVLGLILGEISKAINKSLQARQQ